MKQYRVNYIDLETGEKMAYRNAGNSEQKILLLHGNMSSSVHYQPLMELLEKDFTVYAVDLIGFGDSTYNREINTIHDFSRDVTNFIEKMNLDNLIIVGWSTGGGVALEVAADIPEKIKKIILQSSLGVTGYPFFKIDENMMPILTERIYKREDIENDKYRTGVILEAYKNKNREFFRNTWDMLIYDKNKPSEEDYEIYLDAILKQRNLVDVYVSLANFNITDKFNGVNEGSNRISLIKAPVVLFHGRDDKVVPLEKAEETKKFFGDQAKLIIFENQGHSLITDDLENYYRHFINNIK